MILQALKEEDNNTTLENLYEAKLAAGEEEYIHLIANVKKTINTNGILIRFNLGGTCYYCEIEN